MSTNTSTKVLSKEEIFALAPPVAGTEKHSRTSDKYTFIPTKQIIEDLRLNDWLPVHAEVVKARKDEDAVFAKHLLRFRAKENLSVVLDDGSDIIIPELVITNSHDGKNAFRTHIGIFREVCSNGLLAADGVVGAFTSMRVTHKGYGQEAVLEMINNTINGFSKVLENIDNYRTLELTPGQRQEFAEEALWHRWRYEYDRPVGITPELLLQSRRKEDHGNDLWTVFNVLQENIIKGGVSGVNADGRQVSSRAVRNIRESVRINKNLWDLTENTYNKLYSKPKKGRQSAVIEVEAEVVEVV